MGGVIFEEMGDGGRMGELVDWEEGNLGGGWGLIERRKEIRGDGREGIYG